MEGSPCVDGAEKDDFENGEEDDLSDPGGLGGANDDALDETDEIGDGDEEYFG